MSDFVDSAAYKALFDENGEFVFSEENVKTVFNAVDKIVSRAQEINDIICGKNGNNPGTTLPTFEWSSLQYKWTEGCGRGCCSNSYRHELENHYLWEKDTVAAMAKEQKEKEERERLEKAKRAAEEKEAKRLKEEKEKIEKEKQDRLEYERLKRKFGNGN